MSSPGGGFGTDVETQRAAARSIQAVNSEIQGILGQVKGHVEELSGGWAGQAKAAFDQLMERWGDDARKLSDALDNIGTQMAGSSEEYQRQEEEAQSSLRGILG